ncbi:MAG: hypothetical protein ACE15F_19220 [bacterium]
MIDRRGWLKSLTAGLCSLTAGRSLGSWAAETPKPEAPAPVNPSPFRHRGYLGWITDLAARPDANAPWPSMRLDTRLLEDYRQCCGVLRRLGFNEISIWGLYVSRAWPVDIVSSVTPERGALVEQLIETARQSGLRVLSGLGVYSWGFDDIIAVHPQLSRGNPHALCASEPQSWEWMRKVLDFVFTRFPIDGVSLQSADQGRCRCEACAKLSDPEYHALLNTRTADYIRRQWPDKTIGVNSWGMRFGDPAARPALVDMSGRIDYLIDVHDSSRAENPAYRKQLIQNLKCDFGTLGGPQVEPPQHWQRDRWFLPTAKGAAKHLQELAADGGRACEYFFHILENPGDELTLWVAGKVLSDPTVPWENHLRDSVQELYGVERPAARDALAELFVDAEDAYFKHLDKVPCGTISLEPLIGDQPGPPIYLQPGLNDQQREEYRKDLRAIQERFIQLVPEVPQKERMRKVIVCLENAMKDIGPLKP